MRVPPSCPSGRSPPAPPSSPRNGVRAADAARSGTAAARSPRAGAATRARRGWRTRCRPVDHRRHAAPRRARRGPAAAVRLVRTSTAMWPGRTRLGVPTPSRRGARLDLRVRASSVDDVGGEVARDELASRPGLADTRCVAGATDPRGGRRAPAAGRRAALRSAGASGAPAPR